MNRRSFLKSVGKTIGGVLGVGAVGLPKAKAIPDTIITANGTDAVQGWPQPNCFDFSPDEIVSCEKYRGRCLIICKHSVWEIFEDWDGMLSRKQLSCTGVNDCRIVTHRYEEPLSWNGEFGRIEGVRFIET